MAGSSGRHLSSFERAIKAFPEVEKADPLPDQSIPQPAVKTQANGGLHTPRRIERPIPPVTKTSVENSPEALGGATIHPGKRGDPKNRAHAVEGPPKLWQTRVRGPQLDNRQQRRESKVISLFCYLVLRVPFTCRPLSPPGSQEDHVQILISLGKWHIVLRSPWLSLAQLVQEI